MKIKKTLLALLLGSSAFLFAGTLGAQELPVEEAAEAVEAVAGAISFEDGYAAFMETPGAAFFTISNLWLLIAAALVFIMHLGFATVESGLSQSKNTVNILFKNVFIICMGLITYALWGFNAMYPGFAEGAHGFFAMGSWFDVTASVDLMTAEYADYTWYTDFIFQAMFAATAATIVSGAVAERVKLSSFMIFATLLVTFAYPITGSWEWGGGWLNTAFPDAEFVDFAGSSLVHAFGGFAALACVLVLGPRAGKYVNGQIRPILGHSMPLATIGVFLLFLGWFGFNGGSVLSADPYLVSLVFVTTALAAAAGGLGSIFTSWIFLKKPDLSMGLNGILAGLVGITAGADTLTPFAAIAVGLIAGVLVVFSIIFFDKIKIDDPVGAISVHGVCGVFGTLAVAIFGDAAPFSTQLIGTLSIAAFAFVFSFLVFSLLKITMGVRVSPEEEAEGLDIGEHGQEAYPDFGGSSRAR
jgi:Amt family ammonium transporter